MAEQLNVIEQMDTGLFADCTREEFQRRIRRLREEMKSVGVDGLLLTAANNFRYATAFFEFGSIIPAYFYCVFIPRDESLPPAIFCPEDDRINPQQSWIETLVLWSWPSGFYTAKVGDSLIESLAAWLRKLGLDGARVATEMSAHFRLGHSIEVFDGIRAALPEVRWADCGEIIWAVRSIKSVEEIRRLREAGRISCLGVRSGFEAIREGMSEREIANVMAETMFSEGASEIRFLSLYAGPQRALWADSTPNREMVIRPGSLLQFDGGCLYDGYFCDFKRFASLGEPTAAQRRFFETAMASESAAIEAVAPGVTYGEVYAVSQQVLRDEGYGDFVNWCQKMSLSSIGHNLGLDIHEMPGISIGSDLQLQPNMVLAIEPYLWHEGRYPLWELPNKYGCEDMVLVTEEGHEIMTPDSILSRELWIA